MNCDTYLLPARLLCDAHLCISSLTQYFVGSTETDWPTKRPTLYLLYARSESSITLTPDIDHPIERTWADRSESGTHVTVKEVFVCIPYSASYWLSRSHSGTYTDNGGLYARHFVFAVSHLVYVRGERTVWMWVLPKRVGIHSGILWCVYLFGSNVSERTHTSK